VFDFCTTYVVTDTSTSSTAGQERTNNASKVTLMISIEETSANMNSINALSSGPDSPLDSVGRLKAPPTCDDPRLQAEAMSSEQLSKFVFAQKSNTTSTVLRSTGSNVVSSVTISCYSSSSTSCGDIQSADEKLIDKDREGIDMNTRVLRRETSRQGRETQRWVTHENTQQAIRLVTGCVPILSNGNILFVSASRKSEWILPKGGWENDETMEESAVRETYEEAGVVGFLGPRLNEVCYEARKSRKRRLEIEELKKEKADFLPVESESNSEKTASLHSPLYNDHSVAPLENSSLQGKAESHVSFFDTEPVMMSDAVVARLRGSAAKISDETSSIASDSSFYSHVKMTLFPLYITEIMETWPESGRIRKAVDIDEAINMMESRSEFHTILLEVKARGLHLVHQR
jgi:8-oxo-dGTP pyrophosphatase MutT (NUDIX family)